MTVAMSKHFLSAWLRNPLQTGALLPSGADLAQAMAAHVHPGLGGVLELGAGTGAITRALFERGLRVGELILVEKDPGLADLLARRFPDAVVLRGDAGRLKRLLLAEGVGHPQTVVSSLPLLSMPGLTRLRVLSEIVSVLGPGGTYVQFTYSPRPPIPVALAAALGVTGTRVARVPWNLPPAAVWVYRRQTGVADRGGGGLGGPSHKRTLGVADEQGGEAVKVHLVNRGSFERSQGRQGASPGHLIVEIEKGLLRALCLRVA